jgi:hypothetical protein
VEFLWLDVERHGLQPRSHSMLPRRYVPCCVQCVLYVQCIVCAHCVYFMCLMYPVCEPMQPICPMDASSVFHVSGILHTHCQNGVKWSISDRCVV